MRGSIPSSTDGVRLVSVSCKVCGDPVGSFPTNHPGTEQDHWCREPCRPDVPRYARPLLNLLHADHGLRSTRWTGPLRCQVLAEVLGRSVHAVRRMLQILRVRGVVNVTQRGRAGFSARLASVAVALGLAGGTIERPRTTPASVGVAVAFALERRVQERDESPLGPPNDWQAWARYVGRELRRRPTELLQVLGRLVRRPTSKAKHSASDLDAAVDELLRARKGPPIQDEAAWRSAVRIRLKGDPKATDEALAVRRDREDRRRSASSRAAQLEEARRRADDPVLRRQRLNETMIKAGLDPDLLAELQRSEARS